MWRLKIGDEGAGDRWLQTTCNFHGRQVWEFDPDLGTPEERAEVARLRQEFTENRFQKKYSEDLLMRMQCAKLNQHRMNIPTVKLEESAELTEEHVLCSLRRALSQFSTLQARDGHWPGDYGGIMYLMPFWIFALHVTGSLKVVLSPEHQREICRYIYNHQNEDGGWGSQILGPSTMIGSCLNYTTLRLLGEVPSDDHDALGKGRTWILSHGTATAAPQWAKIFLSIIGAYDWSGIYPIIPELWLVPRFLPFHPGRFWCFTRLTYMAMAFIYGKKFVGPITPTIIAIRKELYDIPYNEIDWNKARGACAQDDILYPRSLTRKVIWTCLTYVEPMLNCWPINKLRVSALSHIMEHIHYEDENTRYLGICPIIKALNMICCWIENPNSDAFIRHLPRIFDYLWLSEDGMKTKIYDGNHNWETSLIVQAFCSTDLISEFHQALESAHGYLKYSQILQNHPGDQSYWHRHRSKGSWAFSTVDNGWPSVDTTAEVIQALLLLSTMPPNLVGDPIKEESLYDAVDCLLSFMNKDGTFSTYECKRTTAWLEVLNPCENFRKIVIDHPNLECTSSAIQALALFKRLYPRYRSEEIGKCISKAALFIENDQNRDGSWYGAWGICFTYGTFFAVKGLVAAGRTFENSALIRKACDFLLSKQLNTGGWGESYLSSQNEVYAELGSTHAVNTAWAMLGLIYAGQIERDPTPLHPAARVLINMQLETGEFPQQEHVGSANYGSVYFNYPNYRNLFPIWALGEYRHRLHRGNTNGSI